MCWFGCFFVLCLVRLVSCVLVLFGLIVIVCGVGCGVCFFYLGSLVNS